MTTEDEDTSSRFSQQRGRQLKSFDNIRYTYNANGIHAGKTVCGVRHRYTLDGTKVLREEWSDNMLVPLYDNEDGVCGVIYNNEPFYFQKNLQGDVIVIYDRNTEVVARYTYDAWGKVLSVRDGNGADVLGCCEHIAVVNPYRYRSYYYDEELGIYYLQSRYYDPTVGRFINGDNIIAGDIYQKSVLTNQFAYCENDLINETDLAGKLALRIILRAVFGAMIGAGLLYLSDVLFNLLDCAQNNKKVTNEIWKTQSGTWMYIAAIMNGAIDATLRLGTGLSVLKAVMTSFVELLDGWLSGSTFSIDDLFSKLLWNVILVLVTISLVKKFTPKQGKALNQYIRKTFHVKGTTQYTAYYKSVG